MKPLKKEGPAQDPRLRALVPKLEALPRELQEMLAEVLEAVLRAHQAAQLRRGSQRQRRSRSSEAGKASD